jgi:hypothetical protein
LWAPKTSTVGAAEPAAPVDVAIPVVCAIERLAHVTTARRTNISFFIKVKPPDDFQLLQIISIAYCQRKRCYPELRFASSS